MITTAENLMSKTGPMIITGLMLNFVFNLMVIIVLTTMQGEATEEATEGGTTSTITHRTKDLSLNIISKNRIGGTKITEGIRKMIIPIADITTR